MKKYLAFVLLLCAGMVACAQWSVSANVSYSNTSFTYTKGGLSAFNNSLPQGSTFDFAPRLGYAFSEDFSIGFDLGFGYSNYTFTDGFYNPVTEAWEQSEILEQELYTSTVGLFLRMRLLSWGRLSLHAEFTAGFRMGFGSNTSTQYTENAWDELVEVVTSRDVHDNQLKLQVVPVFHYVLGNHTDGTDKLSHFSLDLYLNFASLAFAQTTTNVYGEKSELGDGSELYSQTVTKDFNLAIRVLNASPVNIGLTYTF